MPIPLPNKSPYDYAAMREQDERGKITAAERKGKIDTAKEFKKLGVSFDIIKQATGLTDDEIEKIAERRVAGTT